MEIYRTLSQHEHAARERLIRAVQKEHRTAITAERVWAGERPRQLSEDELDTLDLFVRKLLRHSQPKPGRSSTRGRPGFPFAQEAPPCPSPSTNSSKWR